MRHAKPHRQNQDGKKAELETSYDSATMARKNPKTLAGKKRENLIARPRKRHRGSHGLKSTTETTSWLIDHGNDIVVGLKT
jgi:hypothetical protein